MSVQSSRTTMITFSGDVTGTQVYSAGTNSNSSGDIVPTALAAGDNVITVPAGGTVPTCCTIIKPSGNTVDIKLKGVGGDTGILLHRTDPDSISIGNGVASIVLNAVSLVNVRLVWS